ncbi:unnamed protein product [Hermetia illucens]|uniref:Uncharacterized protein n=1 Tax=Hermetia illucens TaxID=343691 RepID=A0A7R8Z4R0_HERIL|nr:unnamed protein product [Hermetia illucens]
MTFRPNRWPVRWRSTAHDRVQFKTLIHASITVGLVGFARETEPLRNAPHVLNLKDLRFPELSNPFLMTHRLKFNK